MRGNDAIALLLKSAQQPGYTRRSWLAQRNREHKARINDRDHRSPIAAPRREQLLVALAPELGEQLDNVGLFRLLLAHARQRFQGGQPALAELLGVLWLGQTLEQKAARCFLGRHAETLGLVVQPRGLLGGELYPDDVRGHLPLHRSSSAGAQGTFGTLPFPP